MNMLVAGFIDNQAFYDPIADLRSLYSTISPADNQHTHVHVPIGKHNNDNSNQGLYFMIAYIQETHFKKKNGCYTMVTYVFS